MPPTVVCAGTTRRWEGSGGGAERLGHAVDETSAKAEWHIPRAHYLESWGDARAVGGTVSIVQPLILPLFNGRSPIEVLGLMVAGKDRPGYDIVREIERTLPSLSGVGSTGSAAAAGTVTRA